MDIGESQSDKSLVVTATLPIRLKDRALNTSISASNNSLTVYTNNDSDGAPPTDTCCLPTTSSRPLVLRGGFRPLPSRDYHFEPDFPPPPNVAYYLDSHGRRPKSNEQQDRSGKGADAAWLFESQNNRLHGPDDSEDDIFPIEDLQADVSPSRARPKETKGEVSARSINFYRSVWVTRLPELPGGQTFYPSSEQKADFIKAIDTGETFIFCCKCKQQHIPPGPPLTLPGRDVCGSMLPDWFPASKFEKPWEVFTDMLNQLAECVEDLRYLDSKDSPDKQPRDIEWHPYNPRWLEVGRPVEGWWKCRAGVGAPVRERYCRLCHETPADKRTPRMLRELVVKKMEGIENFIRTYTEEAGRHDREYVEAQ